MPSFTVQSIFTLPGVQLSKDPGYRSSAFNHASSGKSRRQSMLLWSGNSAINYIYNICCKKKRKTCISLKRKNIIYFNRTFNAHLAHVIVATSKKKWGWYYNECNANTNTAMKANYVEIQI